MRTLLWTSLLSIAAFAHESGEMSISVGPGQGIVAFEKEQGFKLSPEAMKQFEIRTQKVQNPSDLEIDKTSIAYTLKEQNLYRVRDGFIRRIDFNVKQKGPKNYRVSSSSLKSGDEIVTNGLGFLRIVEISLGSSEHEDEHEGEHEDEHKEGGHND